MNVQNKFTLDLKADSKHSQMKFNQVNSRLHEFYVSSISHITTTSIY